MYLEQSQDISVKLVCCVIRPRANVFLDECKVWNGVSVGSHKTSSAPTQQGVERRMLLLVRCSLEAFCEWLAVRI